MNKTRLRYFEQEDVLHLVISDEPESRSVELSPNITVELNDKNEMIGVEILKASAFLRDTVLESVQAKTLQLVGATRRDCSLALTSTSTRALFAIAIERNRREDA